MNFLANFFLEVASLIKYIKDLENFYVLSRKTLSGVYRYEIFAYIDNVKQIQCVASSLFQSGDSYKTCSYATTELGWRTTIEAVNKKYVAALPLEKVNKEELFKICPDLANMRYSTNCADDRTIRRTYVAWL